MTDSAFQNVVIILGFASGLCLLAALGYIFTFLIARSTLLDVLRKNCPKLSKEMKVGANYGMIDRAKFFELIYSSELDELPQIETAKNRCRNLIRHFLILLAAFVFLQIILFSLAGIFFFQLFHHTNNFQNLFVALKLFLLSGVSPFKT